MDEYGCIRSSINLDSYEIEFNMKHLKIFDNIGQYQDWMANDAVYPSVCLIKDTGQVIYHNAPVAPIFGVFIQHVDGHLYTIEEWTSHGYAAEEANGIAVIDTSASFVMAKSLVATEGRWSFKSSLTVSGLIAATSLSTAKADYNGEMNTALISAADAGSAARACKAYIFPNGKEGYLPAAGEWDVVNTHISEIEEALSLIGVNLASAGRRFSSSTRYSESYMWVYSWGEGYYKLSNTSALYIWPFTSI